MSKSFNEKSGVLELVIGPMFSGKSTSLMNKIRQHQILQRNVLVLKHSSDQRYSAECIASHDFVVTNATSTTHLKDVYDTSSYKNASSIFIEEAQFFDDLHEFVQRAVEDHGKHVVVVGLDGDYERVPYMQVLSLIPLADSVERRNSLCVKCMDGTLASFSQRIVPSNERHVVGGTDKYIPVCRYHYLHPI